MRVRRKKSAARIVVRPFHRAQFLFNWKFFPGFQQQNLQSVSCEDVRCHSAGRARSDDDSIVCLGKIYLWRCHRETSPLTHRRSLAPTLQSADYAKSGRSMFEKKENAARSTR